MGHPMPVFKGVLLASFVNGADEPPKIGLAYQHGTQNNQKQCPIEADSTRNLVHSDQLYCPA